MKNFYVLFFAGFIILSALLYFSVWWFLGGVTLIAIGTIYHFYRTKLKMFDATVLELELQVEELQLQLDSSLVKEEKATKDAAQIRQLKQELLSIISHEIRTPMNGVLGMTLLLEETTLTKEQKECTDTIKSCGQNLLAIVNEILLNDILDYSKLEGKDKRLENIDFDLLDTVEEVMNMFGTRAGKAGIDLLYDIDDNVSLQLLGDNKRLREVLMNLVENAVKFTQKGEILLSVQCLSNSALETALNFQVRDSGIGMTEEKIQQLFYELTGNEFNNENEKPGVGLIICRKQVELMGGKIEVRSTPGKGSTFSFSLLLNHSQQSTRSNIHLGNMASLAGKNILVVDDNITSRSILIRQLKAWKVLPVGADSGMQALEVLTQNSSFDLILTDVNMQQVDGIQLARLVKGKYPEIPVILLNLAGNQNYLQDPALISGIIEKPIRQHKLRDTILEVLTKPSPVKQNNERLQLENNFSTKFPLRILIAEDNLINQKIAMKILTRLGYQPKIANNGREALEMCGQEQYDIILMDVQMPEMDGLEATRMIRGKLDWQPIIMAMTANVLQGDRDACMQAGMDGYISKPIDIKELLSQLEKWALTIINKSQALT
ncbi:MAG: response regulator [Chitinophagaceae bacterium]